MCTVNTDNSHGVLLRGDAARPCRSELKVAVPYREEEKRHRGNLTTTDRPEHLKKAEYVLRSEQTATTTVAENAVLLVLLWGISVAVFPFSLDKAISLARVAGEAITNRRQFGLLPAGPALRHGA